MRAQRRRHFDGRAKVLLSRSPHMPSVLEPAEPGTRCRSFDSQSPRRVELPISWNVVRRMWLGGSLALPEGLL